MTDTYLIVLNVILIVYILYQNLRQASENRKLTDRLIDRDTTTKR